jgi:hypothetical protein
MRLLTNAEMSQLALPRVPPWLANYGPQPNPTAPWRLDPVIQRLAHPAFPDDVQVRVSARETCWARITGVADGTPRGNSYSAALLNAPETSGLRLGDTIYLATDGNDLNVVEDPNERDSI